MGGRVGGWRVLGGDGGLLEVINRSNPFTKQPAAYIGLSRALHNYEADGGHCH